MKHVFVKVRAWKNIILKNFSTKHSDTLMYFYLNIGSQMLGLVFLVIEEGPSLNWPTTVAKKLLI